eukprot:5322604-Pleurochrysis_carterae.AAC.2
MFSRTRAKTEVRLWVFMLLYGRHRREGMDRLLPVQLSVQASARSRQAVMDARLSSSARQDRCECSSGRLCECRPAILTRTRCFWRPTHQKAQAEVALSGTNYSWDVHRNVPRHYGTGAVFTMDMAVALAREC